MITITEKKIHINITKLLYYTAKISVAIIFQSLVIIYCKEIQFYVYIIFLKVKKQAPCYYLAKRT